MWNRFKIGLADEESWSVRVRFLGFRTKLIKLCERAQNTRPENGVRSCAHYCLNPTYGSVERCVRYCCWLDLPWQHCRCHLLWVCLSVSCRTYACWLRFSVPAQSFRSHFCRCIWRAGSSKKKCSLDKLEGLEIKQSKKDFDGHHCVHVALNLTTSKWRVQCGKVATVNGF